MKESSRKFHTSLYSEEIILFPNVENVLPVILSLLFASWKNKKVAETTLRGLIHYLHEGDIRQEVHH